MTDPLYTSLAEIEKVSGVHRRASIEANGVIELGVHGPIKEHYNLGSQPDRALPVDYLVAAAGG